MIFLEINEFNPDLMQRAADTLHLKNLQHLLSLRKTYTTTDDKEERYGLDPWVQWVSIHTGRPSTEHGVQHLGDVPKLSHKQIWEKLGEEGYRCGVWGAMNASRGQVDACDFFFPDPWTFSERAYPEHLNDLLEFPRYFSKNYCDLDKTVAAKKCLKLMRFCLRPTIAWRLLPIAPLIVGNVLRHGTPAYLLFALFDVVNAALFAHYYNRYKPDFGLVFMNSLAHLQHHKWTDENGLSEEMKIGFRLFDRAMGLFFNAIPANESVVIANSFTQRCTIADNEFLYRQKNPETFLEHAGIAFQRVEQMMTNDGHVFFDSADAAREAARILEEARVDGEPAFYVEWHEDTPDKLFYQVRFWHPVDDSVELHINGRTLRFFDEFETVTQRSGSHVQEGHVLATDMELPEKIYNHELYNYILQRFNVAA